jgi:hypothetical protein
MSCQPDLMTIAMRQGNEASKADSSLQQAITHKKKSASVCDDDSTNSLFASLASQDCVAGLLTTLPVPTDEGDHGDETPVNLRRESVQSVDGKSIDNDLCSGSADSLTSAVQDAIESNVSAKSSGTGRATVVRWNLERSQSTASSRDRLSDFTLHLARYARRSPPWLVRPCKKDFIMMSACTFLYSVERAFPIRAVILWNG